MQKSTSGIMLWTFTAVFCLLFAGCQTPIRFAPSEAQKQNAQLTYQLAVKANTAGAEAGSPLTEQLEAGTATNSAYMGQPTTPANVEQFNEVNKAAQTDAGKRPNPWDTANTFLDLGIAVAALFGGGAAVKVSKFLQDAKAKSNALKEVVLGSELFKMNADEKAVQDFKDAQANQSATTKQLVTQITTKAA